MPKPINLENAVDIEHPGTANQIAKLLGLPAKEEKKEEKDETDKTNEAPEIQPAGLQGEGGVQKEDGEEDKGSEGEEDGGDEEAEEGDLLAELARLSSLLNPEQTAEQKEEKTEEKPEEKQTIEKEVEKALTPVSTEIPNFLKDDDFEGIFESKDRKVFQEILNKVATHAIEVGRKMAMQDAMKVFPALIQNTTNGVMAASEFWRENPQLKQLTDKYPGIRDYVTFRSNEIQKANPSWKLGQIYGQVKQEVSTLLKAYLENNNGSQETSGKTAGKKTGLATRPGAKRGSEKQKEVTGQQKYINDLLNFQR